MHPQAKTRPKLIITCGLTGTGKSTIAKGLAEARGWAIVSSDEVRKGLAKIPPTRHEYVPFQKGIYSAQFTSNTYDRMNEIAERFLREGKSVIIDASFSKKVLRAKTYDLAKRLGAEITWVELICPEEEIKRRLDSRMRREDISDGRWEIFLQMKTSFQEINEFNDEEHVVVDTSKPKHEAVNRALNLIDKQRCN